MLCRADNDSCCLFRPSTSAKVTYMGGLSIWSARFCTFAKRLALIVGCAILVSGTDRIYPDKGEENAVSSIQAIGCACGRSASRRLCCRRRPGLSSADSPRTVAAADVPDDLCSRLRHARFFAQDLRQFLSGKS